MIDLKLWERLAVFDLNEACKEAAREVLHLRRRMRHDRIDELLEEINVEVFPKRVLITLLVSTSPVIAELRKRDGFRQRVLEKLAAKNGYEAAEYELQGL